MRNRIVVNIGGKDYTMVAAEDEGYVRRCAELVNRQLSEVSAGGRLSQADAAPGEGWPGGGQQPEAGAV